LAAPSASPIRPTRHWADQNFELSARERAEPGPSTETAQPTIRECWIAQWDSRRQVVRFQVQRQGGKTILCLILGFSTLRHGRPPPSLAVQPNQAMAEACSKRAPAARDPRLCSTHCPVPQSEKSRDLVNTLYHKHNKNSRAVVALAVANARVSLRMHAPLSWAWR